MRKFGRFGMVALIAAIGTAGTAHANGVMAEANLARAHGEWGAELGGGYALQGGGFTLRPMAGVMLYDRDGTETRLFGKVEASYTLPASLEFGLGARFTSDRTRGYALVSMPIAPAVRLRANAGEGYFALGARLSF